MGKIFDTTCNPIMQEVIVTAQKVALSDLSVIIIGEHGTGKEWLARLIHKISNRTTGPFWPFDCAAFPECNLEKELFGFEEILSNGIVINRGALEEAEGGTLLLNEISYLPLAIQMKVARAIEFKAIHRIGGSRSLNVNTRIIATLSQPANTFISDGPLSKDIFHRISSVILELPPLRQRKEDIPLLINKFIDDLREHNPSSISGIGEEAMELCISYEWPGNVRHLKNAIEYAFIMCTERWIQPHHLPNYLQKKHNYINLTN